MSEREVRLNEPAARAAKRFLRRQRADTFVSQYASGPYHTHRVLLEAENQVAPRGDYIQGSADEKNQILQINRRGSALLTAEHATVHKRRTGRKKDFKEEDHGTGALAIMVAKTTQTSALIAIGRQTGDANNDRKHPFKEAMAEILEEADVEAHLSLHGMIRGLSPYLGSFEGFSVQLGIGDKPSDATKALVDFMLVSGKDLGLRMGVNQSHLVHDSQTGVPILKEDGTVQTRTFNASKPHTTRAFSQSIAENQGRDDSFAAVQIELSDVLRCHALSKDAFTRKGDRELGVYLGYHFVRSAVRCVPLL